ncbi:MAG: HAD family hydrolase [Rubripirellula sp.]
MSTDSGCENVLSNRRAMEPIRTEVEPRLRPLPGIKAVVFDVYGTLVISGSGDVGSADTTDRGAYVKDALVAIGLQERLEKAPSVDLLHESIAQFNRERVSEACPKPEVDIVEVWRRVLLSSGLQLDAADIEQVVQLAADYESRANPTWPMPNASELLAALRQRGLPLGIVSNAQVFTPCLVEDLVSGKPLEQSGFALDLCVFSNRFRQAKPGPRLFEVLKQGLGRRGISPPEAIYVGNDMLNDVWAASEAGLQTAWFAGDARSCRPRQDDPRCQSLRPDVVLTDLLQLLECMQIK